MHTPRFQNFMVWRKSQQKKLWTNWICFNLDLGKLTNSQAFGMPCQISSMNKKDRCKIPLKPKAPFKWVFMDIVP